MSKLLPRPSKGKSTDLDDDVEDGPAVDTSSEIDKSEAQGEGQGENQGEVQTSNKADNNQAILRILGDGEKVIMTLTFDLVQGQDFNVGLFKINFAQL